MSQREFENYLILLGGLLRLSAKQRAEISGELRDHFEERLGELLEQGIARDEAIQLTLAEFGDAAGLAAAFLHVSRNRRKRWLMKWTIGSIGGLVAAVLLAVALWPEGANVKLTPQAVAQPAAPPMAPVAHKADVKSKEDNNAKAEAALAQQVAAEFVDTPLTDVISFLSDLTGIEFYVNWKKLEEEGIARDVPITITLKKVRVDMLLDLVLAQAYDPAYVVRDGIVVISSAADLENATEVRVYNCRDLLKLAPLKPREEGGFGGGMGGILPAAPGVGAGPGPGGPPGIPGGGVGGEGIGTVGFQSPASQLIEVVITAVAPNTWEDNGGFGTISEFGGLLVVNQNARTHRQIEKVLAMLREAVAKDAEARPGPKK